jgi:hypothetical protein
MREWNAPPNFFESVDVVLIKLKHIRVELELK